MARRLPALVSALALALVVAGCPAPIGHTVWRSSPIAGRIEWADGRPVADAEVVSASGYEDGPCGAPLAHGRTDAAGYFSLPANAEHYSTTWIVPGLDILQPSYRLCVSVNGALHEAYTGAGAYGGDVDRDTLPADSVSCVVWELAAIPQVSCAGRMRREMVSGGRWKLDSAGRDSGSYRAFLVYRPTEIVRGKKTHLWNRPYVYLQWLRPRSTGTQHDIVTTLDLPIDRTTVQYLAAPKLWRREGRWMLSLETMGRVQFGGFSGGELVYALAGPGEATLVAGP